MPCGDALYAGRSTWPVEHVGQARALLQPAPLHDAQAPGVVPGQLANHWLHCGGGQLAPGLAVQRVALEVHQALALPGDAVYVARSIEQIAHFSQAVQLTGFAVAQHIKAVADAMVINASIG